MKKIRVFKKANLHVVLMKRLFLLLSCFLLLNSAIQVMAADISVTKTRILLNPKKTDSFDIKGKFKELSLEEAEDIQLEIGNFSETISMDQFDTVKEKLEYKAPEGTTGIVLMTIDTKKGGFRAKGKGLVLSNLPNPMHVGLTAGSFSECTMIKLQSQKAKKGKSLLLFKKKKGQQFTCIIQEEPIANPSGLFVDTPTQIRIQARLNPDPNLDTDSVKLWRVNKSLKPVGKSIATLLDNGDLSNGDDILNDSVYSAQITFTESGKGVIRLQASADLKIKGKTETVWSPVFTLDVVKKITEEEAQTVVDNQQEALDTWETNKANFGDTVEARKNTAGDIKNLPGVKDSGVSEDDYTVWIEYKSGVKGVLMLNPDGTRGNLDEAIQQRLSKQKKVPGTNIPPPKFSPMTIVLKAGNEDIADENNSVLIWDAYNSQFAPFDEGPAIRDMFQDSECPKFNVTYLIDDECTVNSVDTFTNYGTIVLITHGAVDGDGQVIFLTRENITLESVLGNLLEIILGHIIPAGDVFAIRSGKIRTLSGNFKNGIVYNGSCQSSANNTMSNAFIGKGAQSYFGFTKVVNSDFAQSSAEELFRGLVEEKKNTGDAFDPISPKVDPGAPNATFTHTGLRNIVYPENFRNGNFESGDLTSWTTSGDGRVLSKLGEFNPTEGSYLGIISTGLGFTTSSGSIEQSFCLPVDATSLDFDWNFSSEEFIEYCGSQFQDTFSVDIITDSGTTNLFSRAIDDLCSTVSSTGLAFDQSGSGCIPTDGVGFGTSGNDCTVWSTGWQSESVDISSIAAANDGKGVTLRFSAGDVGDSIFDSAILLDNIKIVTP